MVGGKTERPFPLEEMLAAIPEGGSRRGDWNREQGYASLSDREIIEKLGGFWEHKFSRMTIVRPGPEKLSRGCCGASMR